LFPHDWAGWPVVESTHVDEQIERRVAEEHAVSPSAEFRLVSVGGCCHGRTLYVPYMKRCWPLSVILNLVQNDNAGEFRACEVLSKRFQA
jgi:hypothetical protein